MNKNIDIFTCIANNSDQYMKYLYDNLTNLRSGKNNIRFWSIGNDRWCSAPVRNWTHVENISTSTEYPPSATHAKALNRIIDHIPSDSDYIVIADCDIAILQRDWDETFIKYLEHYNCVGTPKFCNILSVYFTWFHTEVYKNIIPDFMPGNKNTISVPYYKIHTQRQADIFNKSIGDIIVQDTGWMVSKQIINNGYTYKILEYKQINNNPYKLSFNYMDFDGDLFITHMSGSHKHSFNGKVATQWRDGIRRWMEDNNI